MLYILVHYLGLGLGLGLTLSNIWQINTSIDKNMGNLYTWMYDYQIKLNIMAKEEIAYHDHFCLLSCLQKMLSAADMLNLRNSKYYNKMLNNACISLLVHSTI